MPWYEYSVTAGGGKPFVSVLLWHGARRVRILALVDSGADMSAINASYANVLGLDRADAVSETTTVADGGTANCLHWPNAPLDIHFARDRFPFYRVFLEFPPPAAPA